MNKEQRDYWLAVLEANLRRGDCASAALLDATIETASVFDIGPPRCEHGIPDGGYCEPCNLEYKRAAIENP